MSLFSMIVRDTFHFDDGTPAFVASLETRAKTIPPRDCQIIVNNEVKASLRIDGEMILKGKQVPERTITTCQQINVASCGLERGGFTDHIIRSTATSVQKIKTVPSL